MKSMVLIGIIIAGLGAFVLLRGATYKEKHNVVSVGDVHASITERHPVPMWVGGAALIGGLVLIGAGASRRA